MDTLHGQPGLSTIDVLLLHIACEIASQSFLSNYSADQFDLVHEQRTTMYTALNK